MKNEKKTKGAIIQRETKMIMYVVICLVIVVISASYALFFQVDQNSKNQIVKSGDLTFTFKEGSQITAAANEACFEPITSDEATASTDCYYELSVTNGGTLTGAYTINLTPNSSTNAIDSSKLKVIVRKKTGESYTVESGFPKAVNTLTNNAVITRNIAPNQTEVYSIKVFVDFTLVGDADDEKDVSYSIKGVGEVSEGTDLSPNHKS